MGWGLTIKDVYVPRVTEESLEHEIETTQDLITSYETEIKMLISSDPATLNKAGDGVNAWVEWLPNEVDNLLYEYKEAVSKLHMLELAEENGGKNDY